MPSNPSTFRNVHWARQYRRVYGNRPLPHENKTKAALLGRIQRKGLMTKFQLRYFLSDKLSSVPLTLDPGLALALQQSFDCEFACDLVIDLANRRSFYLATRGCYGAAISDALCYYLCSPYYLVLPGFHTHEKLENELGSHL